MERNRRRHSSKKRSNPNFNKGGGNKRGKFSGQSSESFKPSETVYRILCHNRKIGSVIGKGGGIIKTLREETQAKISVAETVSGSEERVITISSESNMTAKTTASDNNQENNDMELHCAAQDALLRVHDRVIEEDIAGENPIFARLLVPNNTVGCILGKKGDVINKLRKETGASIRVLPGDQRPACAMSTDELVQISAKPSVAKIALYQVSTLLHQNPRKDKPPSGNGQNMSHTNSMRVERGSNARGPPSIPWMGPTRFGPDDDYVGTHNDDIASEFSMKVLCLSAKLGDVIGKGGFNVWQLQQETATSILVDDGSVESDERVIRVSALEALRNPRSQTVDAVLSIQDRINEHNIKGIISTRLLIPSSKVGCIIGQGGQVINEMRRRTKAEIRVFPKEEKPNCAGEDEELVQVSGIYNAAKDALAEIALRYRTRCLRDPKPGTEPSLVGPVPGFIPLRNLITEGPSLSGLIPGGRSLGLELLLGAAAARGYGHLTPAPPREYEPRVYQVPPSASGYPGVVDLKIPNSGQVSGIHNINEVPGSGLKPQVPNAIGAGPVSDVHGSNAIYGVDVYQGYNIPGGQNQNAPLNAAYNNYGTPQGPFSDMNSSHTLYHTTTTAATTAAAAATATTNPHHLSYPPQQGYYPESSYQYGT